jgi:hypothetical protein
MTTTSTSVVECKDCCVFEVIVLVFFDSSPFWEKQPRFKNNENKEE